MGEFDITFKSLAERPPYRVARVMGHVPISAEAKVEPLERELVVPLRSVDQAYLIEQNGEKWIEHFEAEVGLSSEDRRNTMNRADLMRIKFDVPVWTTIVLMSPRRGPRHPVNAFRYKQGSLTVVLRPRYVKLWRFPAQVLVGDDLMALPWVGAAKASAVEMDAAIRRIRGIEDATLRSQLSAEMVALSYLQYGNDEVEAIRKRLAMVTTKDILQATPLWQEITEYREKVGEERGRKEGLEQGRREVLNALTLTIRARIPGYGETGWLERIGDVEILGRIFRDLLAAPDAESGRAVLACYQPR